MEAKDTVMNDRQQSEIFNESITAEHGAPCNLIDLSRLWSIVQKKTAQAQAEISFKAGIREVVEWINENIFWRKDNRHINSYYPAEWQAKLKEWGVESPIEKPPFSAGYVDE